MPIRFDEAGGELGKTQAKELCLNINLMTLVFAVSLRFSFSTMDSRKSASSPETLVSFLAARIRASLASWSSIAIVIFFFIPLLGRSPG